MIAGWYAMEALVRTLYALAPPAWTAAAAAYLLVFLHRDEGAERPDVSHRRERNAPPGPPT